VETYVLIEILSKPNEMKESKNEKRRKCLINNHCGD